MVIGSVNGVLSTAFTKLAKLHAKNEFSFALVAGDLFGDGTSEQELSEITSLCGGITSVPLPTYFTVGTNPIPQRIAERIEETGEVCENLYFLGRRGTLKTSEGARIVALGGGLRENLPTLSGTEQKYVAAYTSNDAKALAGSHTTDILLSSDWPLSIKTGSTIDTPAEVQQPQSQQCVADLCSALKPRYHFSMSSDFFYEREPFFHTPTEAEPDSKHITRFISLASLTNSHKQKSLYAFSLDLAAPPLSSIPPGATASPLSAATKKRQALPDQNQSYSRFSTGANHYRPPKRNRRHGPEGPAECFFCLSNPNISTHLITSIGDDAYLTTAKGPLPTKDSFPSLGFPGHMLIIPHAHNPTLGLIPQSSVRASTFKEMERYRSSLHDMVQAKSLGKFSSVTWEVSRSNIRHVHWQFLPVPVDLIASGLVEAAFKVEAENSQYPKFDRRDIGDGAGENGDYFRVWIRNPTPSPASDIQDSNSFADGNAAISTNGTVKREHWTEKSLVLPLGLNARFDIQFGRRVMGKLLKLETRSHWKDCEQSQADEEADAEAFKTAFKQWDFTMED